MNLNGNEEDSGCTCGKRKKIIRLFSVLCAMGLYTEWARCYCAVDTYHSQEQEIGDILKRQEFFVFYMIVAINKQPNTVFDQDFLAMRGSGFGGK